MLVYLLQTMYLYNTLYIMHLKANIKRNTRVCHRRNYPYEAA